MQRRLLLAAVLGLLLAVVTASPGTTAPPADSSALRNAVTVSGLTQHLNAFQSFAKGNPKTRVDGTVGFTDSVDYVAGKLRAAGYGVTVQPFSFDRWEETAAPVFERVSPNPVTYAENTDFLTMEYSGSGDVTGTVQAVAGIVLPPTATRVFATPVLQRPGRHDRPRRPHRGRRGAPGLGRRRPGHQRQRSGSATILEIALQMKRLNIQPTNRVRFAFWGAEELGLLGSEYHVSHLSSAELKNIDANLNFDMVASPNFVRFVYDGDGSATPTKGPTGSGNIEQAFLNYFSSQGLATDPTAFDSRSDYGPFIDRGIPAGGLFSGAEGVKTAAQAATYGGTAGAPYDACYHQACDTKSNINNTSLDQLSDGAADATLQFAMTTSSISGTSRAKSPVANGQGNRLRK